MEKIRIGFMKDLRNIEFGGMVKMIAHTKEWENVENPSLKQVGTILKKQSLQLRLLRNMQLRHPLTKVIHEKMRTRTEYLTCLRMKIESDLLSYKPEYRIAAERLQLWLRGYRKSLYTPSILAQETLIKFILHDRAIYPDVQQATTLLGLDELIEVIAKLAQEINHIFLKRNKDISAKAVKALALRKAAYDDLKLMISTLDVTYNLSNNQKERNQAKELAEAINCQLKDVHATLKSRKTKSKNKKEREKESVAAVNELIHDSKETIETRTTENEQQVVEEKKLLPMVMEPLQMLNPLTFNNGKILKQHVVESPHGKPDGEDNQPQIEQQADQNHCDNTDDNCVKRKRVV